MSYFLLLFLAQAAFGQEEILVGDMVFSRSAQTASTQENLVLWPGGIVPVWFESHISPQRKEMFFKACRSWEFVANVKCVSRSNQTKFLYVRNPPDDPNLLQCYASVGANHTQPALTLSNACWVLPTIVHELGHTFGLTHEHQRADRDRYITVHFENIFGPSQFQIFHMLPPIGPYDFMSIMHYSTFISAKPGSGPAFTSNARNKFRRFDVGSAKAPSFLDGHELRAYYGEPSVPIAAKADVTSVRKTSLSGWAFDPENPSSTVRTKVTIHDNSAGGIVVEESEVIANLKATLSFADKGHPVYKTNHGFHLRYKSKLKFQNWYKITINIYNSQMKRFETSSEYHTYFGPQK